MRRVGACILCGEPAEPGTTTCAFCAGLASYDPSVSQTALIERATRAYFASLADDFDDDEGCTLPGAAA